jgi:hypothetical protein
MQEKRREVQAELADVRKKLKVSECPVVPANQQDNRRNA